MQPSTSQVTSKVNDMPLNLFRISLGLPYADLRTRILPEIVRKLSFLKATVFLGLAKRRNFGLSVCHSIR